ncbi:MAG: carbohydrate kinase [Actinobacteria bacterium]|nr:carbohydrate kinase [Actinomycetota bacterium]
MAIWVCGEALIDRITKDGALEEIPGGGPANTAHALARLGIASEFIGGLSSDSYGQMMREQFTAAGVGLRFTPTHDLPTCTANVTIAADGSASYQFVIEGTATFAYDEKVLPDLSEIASDVVHALYFGTLATIIEPGASVLFEWMKGAVGKVPIIFDPNIRPSVLGDREKYQASVARFLQISDVVKASSDDIQWLYPQMHEFEVAKSWLEHGVKLVVITRGEHGLVGITSEHMIVLAEGIHLHGIDRALSSELSHILHRAVQASAITCSRQGAQPPYRNEL